MAQRAAGQAQQLGAIELVADETGAAADAVEGMSAEQAALYQQLMGERARLQSEFAAEQERLRRGLAAQSELEQQEQGLRAAEDEINAMMASAALLRSWVISKLPPILE